MPYTMFDARAEVRQEGVPAGIRRQAKDVYAAWGYITALRTDGFLRACLEAMDYIEDSDHPQSTRTQAVYIRKDG